METTRSTELSANGSAATSATLNRRLPRAVVFAVEVARAIISRDRSMPVTSTLGQAAAMSLTTTQAPARFRHPEPPTGPEARSHHVGDNSTV